MISGTQSPHLRLESALAKWKGTQAALSFSSGYAAALGTIPALVTKNDIVLLDKLCHASLIDGARLSGAVMRVFPHNHLGKLESHLEWAQREHTGKRILIVTESVFSMDGSDPSALQSDRTAERLMCCSRFAVRSEVPSGQRNARVASPGGRPLQLRS